MLPPNASPAQTGFQAMLVAVSAATTPAKDSEAPSPRTNASQSSDAAAEPKGATTGVGSEAKRLGGKQNAPAGVASNKTNAVPTVPAQPEDVAIASASAQPLSTPAASAVSPGRPAAGQGSGSDAAGNTSVPSPGEGQMKPDGNTRRRSKSSAAQGTPSHAASPSVAQVSVDRVQPSHTLQPVTGAAQLIADAIPSSAPAPRTQPAPRSGMIGAAVAADATASGRVAGSATANPDVPANKSAQTPGQPITPNVSGNPSPQPKQPGSAQPNPASLAAAATSLPASPTGLPAHSANTNVSAVQPAQTSGQRTASNIPANPPQAGKTTESSAQLSTAPSPLASAAAAAPANGAAAHTGISNIPAVQTSQSGTQNSGNNHNAGGQQSSSGAGNNGRQNAANSSGAQAHGNQASSQPQPAQPIQPPTTMAAPQLAQSTAHTAPAIAGNAANPGSSASSRSTGNSGTPHVDSAELPGMATRDLMPASGINAARLVQSISETEMRVAMNSPDFGGIAIRTSVQQQQMVAQISVDHSGLAGAISARAAAMESRIGSNLGLQAAIQVNHSGTAFAGGQGGSSSQGEARSSSPSAPIEGTAVPATAESQNHADWQRPGTGEMYRLDIRA